MTYLPAIPQGSPESLEHVLYEFEMLGRTAAFLCGLRGPRPQPGEQMSVYLESYLVHLRNLNSFFFPKTQYPTDISPQHYFPGFSAVGKEHPESDRLHKEITHLTYNRKTKPENGVWYIRQVAEPILDNIKKFTALIPTNSPLLDYGTNRERLARALDFVTQLQAIPLPANVASTTVPPTMATGAPASFYEIGDTAATTGYTGYVDRR